MIDRNGQLSDEQLEAYLDGLLSGTERMAVEEALRANPERWEEVELQARIDSTLSRAFPAGVPTEARLAAVAAQLSTASGVRGGRKTHHGAGRVAPWLMGLAAAAALAGVLATWRPLGSGHPEPVFQPRPVAAIYAEAVASGFTPYYECHEEERFAAVFARRQGQPLRLLPLPQGVQMLGLSYPGGLSRDSTAMLCLVEERPVIVLIDRLDADQPEAQKDRDPAVQVFREARDGLVFYEVTPFDRPRVTQCLVTADGR